MMQTKKIYSLYKSGFLFFLSAVVLLNSCGASRSISKKNVESQSSVLISLKNGLKKKGIIFKGDESRLIYIDADKKSGQLDTILVKDIASVHRAEQYFDFQGNVIPKEEISSYAGMTRTLLYGGAGLILGAAAGTGLALAVFSPKKEGERGNSGAAIASIAGCGVAGCWLFGRMGAAADFDDALFEVREARGKQVSRRLKELQKQKEELERGSK